jgi:hypothetical protein
VPKKGDLYSIAGVIQMVGLMELDFTRPTALVSDGAPNFHNAYNKVFWTYKTPQTKHIRHIRLQGDHNNNKMERFNGEVRDREKVMKGLKKGEVSLSFSFLSASKDCSIIASTASLPR